MKRRLLEKLFRQVELEPKHKLVLRLYYDEYEPMSFGQIGEMFKINKSTVKRWHDIALNRFAPNTRKMFK